MPVDSEKVEALVSDLPVLVENFENWWYDNGGGPSLYFYQKTISKVRESSLESLLKDDYFIELLYAALTAWDMDARAASLKDFGDFKTALNNNREDIQEISGYYLDEIDESEFKYVEEKLEALYKDLDVMKSNGKLVANSKLLHFTIPDLVMPMDRGNTLTYFYGNTGASRKRFIEVFEASWRVAQNVDLGEYVDDTYNLSKPKVVDNAINAKMRT